MFSALKRVVTRLTLADLQKCLRPKMHSRNVTVVLHINPDGVCMKANFKSAGLFLNKVLRKYELQNWRLRKSLCIISLTRSNICQMDVYQVQTHHNIYHHCCVKN